MSNLSSIITTIRSPLGNRACSLCTLEWLSKHSSRDRIREENILENWEKFNDWAENRIFITLYSLLDLTISVVVKYFNLLQVAHFLSGSMYEMIAIKLTFCSRVNVRSDSYKTYFLSRSCKK